MRCIHQRRHDIGRALGSDVFVVFPGELRPRKAQLAFGILQHIQRRFYLDGELFFPWSLASACKNDVVVNKLAPNGEQLRYVVGVELFIFALHVDDVRDLRWGREDKWIWTWARNPSTGFMLVWRSSVSIFCVLA